MATISITHDDLYAEIRSYLVDMFETDLVIKSNQNGSPLPENAIVMFIVNETDLDMSINRYQKPQGKATVQQSVELLMQVDFYGNEAQSRARTLTNLWRNHYSTDRLNICQPLYSKAPRHAPFVNEKSMYEDRYIVEIYLQYNPYVTHQQNYVDDVDISLKQI